MEKKLDCKGMACPLPVVTAKKAMEEFTEEGIVEVVVDIHHFHFLFDNHCSGK